MLLVRKFPFAMWLNANAFQISEALVRQRFVHRCDCMDGQWDELWNDLRLDGTLESMWIVSACHVQEETENNTRILTNTRRCTKCPTTALGVCFSKHNKTLGSIGLIHTSSSLKHVYSLK